MKIIAIVLAIVGVIIANGLWRIQPNPARQTKASLVLSVLGILLFLIGIVLGFLSLSLFWAIMLIVITIVIGVILMPKK